MLLKELLNEYNDKWTQIKVYGFEDMPIMVFESLHPEYLDYIVMYYAQYDKYLFIYLHNRQYDILKGR